MLKNSGSTEFKIQLGKGGVRVGYKSKGRCGRSEIDGSGKEDVEVDDGEVEVDEVGKKV